MNTEQTCKSIFINICDCIQKVVFLKPSESDSYIVIERTFPLYKEGDGLSQNWVQLGEGSLLEFGNEGLIGGLHIKWGGFMIFLINFLLCEFFLFLMLYQYQLHINKAI